MAFETKIYITCDTPGCYMTHGRGLQGELRTSVYKSLIIDSAKKMGWEIKEGRNRCPLCVEMFGKNKKVSKNVKADENS